MSTSRAPHAASTTAGGDDHQPPQKTYYESQREMLVTEIAQSLEHVLVNINRLNRSMEELIQVGNEFAPVESLWSHFESVMGNQGHSSSSQQQQGQEGGGGAEARNGGGGAGKKGGDEGDDESVVEGGEGEREGEGDESMY
ncbi:hypothetical protein DM02DRAFT_303907 [Periconia macrospinosa]|uniref:DASH complex subunit DAD1 n=1 Tax=Periconia macrospinosa TaxID=97972 RepID=A0A2V1DVY8_9PLEO|nr:hypothetical protein DM02DRAFT_303907 [Periconia macrospinosa]